MYLIYGGQFTLSTQLMKPNYLTYVLGLFGGLFFKTIVFFVAEIEKEHVQHLITDKT